MLSLLEGLTTQIFEMGGQCSFAYQCYGFDDRNTLTHDKLDIFKKLVEADAEGTFYNSMLYKVIPFVKQKL